MVRHYSVDEETLRGFPASTYRPSHPKQGNLQKICCRSICTRGNIYFHGQASLYSEEPQREKYINFYADRRKKERREGRRGKTLCQQKGNVPPILSYSFYVTLYDWNKPTWLSVSILWTDNGSKTRHYDQPAGFQFRRRKPRLAETFFFWLKLTFPSSMTSPYSMTWLSSRYSSY